MTVAVTSGMGIERFLEEMIVHLVPLRRSARRLASRRDDVADDLVQETFARALAARGRYRSDGNARAWLERILLNEARTHHRRESRAVRLQALLALDGEPLAAPSAVVGRGLVRALASLRPSYREVVKRIDVDGLGYEETARALDVPLGTVMSRLHRARRELRALLGDGRERRASAA